MIRTLFVNCVRERAEFEARILCLEFPIESIGVVSDGLEAVEQAVRSQPDLIITCIGSLTSMDGLRMIRELRDRDVRSPVIVATAGSTTEQEALQAGANALLRLPAGVDEWHVAVRALVPPRPDA